MPVRLATEALLRVSDSVGHVVRIERLAARTDLRERLAIAHDNYARQGWAVDDLHPGQWAFVAEKGPRRLLVAIRAAPDGGAALALRDIEWRSTIQLSVNRDPLDDVA